MGMCLVCACLGYVPDAYLVMGMCLACMVFGYMSCVGGVCDSFTLILVQRSSVTNFFYPNMVLSEWPVVSWELLLPPGHFLCGLVCNELCLTLIGFNY